MKRVGFIFQDITNLENIKNAIYNASKKKRKRRSVIRILDDIDYYALEIQSMLMSKTYSPSPYIVETIIDGSNNKERSISKPSFYPDQCIHWAIMLVVEPIFNKGMYEYCCGSVPKRGIHYAQKAVEKWIRKDTKHTKYILQIDITKFYPSINHSILKGMLRNKIKDEDALWLFSEIIASTESGLPIGNYTSQWLANFYLQNFDYFVKQELGVKYYIRYMDDCILFGNNKKKLHRNFKIIERHLNELDLNIKGNWQVYRLDKRPLDFLGFKFYRTHKPLRARNSLRIRRRAKRIKKKNTLNYRDCVAMISYMGWLKHTDSKYYYQKNIKPYINIKKMKEVIRNESRKYNKTKQGRSR